MSWPSRVGSMRILVFTVTSRHCLCRATHAVTPVDELSGHLDLKPRRKKNGNCHCESDAPGVRLVRALLKVVSYIPRVRSWGVGEGLGTLVVGWEVCSSSRVESEVSWVPCVVSWEASEAVGGGRRGQK